MNIQNQILSLKGRCPYCDMKIVSIQKSKQTSNKTIVLKAPTTNEYLLKCPRCKNQIELSMQ